MKKITCFLLLTWLAGACTGHKTEPVVNTETEDAIPVRAVKVQNRNSALPVQASGILTSENEQRLSFKIGGVIKKVWVKEGDQVKAGQMLAELDKTEIDAQVRQAQEAQLKAERDLQRVTGLYRDSSATLELLQNATTARDVSNETLKVARFNQQFAEIRANKSGKIIKKLINEGEITGPGLPAFVIFETGPDDWVVKINVSDRDWARLNKGMKAKVTMDAYENQPFTGVVSDLAAAADPANGLYPVEVRIKPNGKRFVPGLFAKVEIEPARSSPYPVIPIEAVVEGDGKNAFVFSIEADGSSVKKRHIQIAYLDGNNAVVASGLDGVEQVVKEGAPYLTEQKKVKVVE